VALQSVRRFHPRSGYFVLLPEAHVANWSAVLSEWSGGHVRPLALPPSEAQRYFRIPEPGYSPMTFHRHRVPEMLWRQGGYDFSVNLDPDVMCARPWDLRILLRIGLIGGRAVGNNARTATWLQQLRQHRNHTAAASAAVAGENSSGGSISTTLLAGSGENVSLLLHRLLGLTQARLAATRELNGGVLIFNNSEAARVSWWMTMTRYHAKLRHVVEGDQDLIGLVLASERSFARYLLPSTYNYAFRRDRERLPYAIAHRLRHGLVEQQIVNVHFVADGKPWQRQQLQAYPLWLLATRLHHLREWLAMARAIRPKLNGGAVGLTSAEHALVGTRGLDAMRTPDGRNASRFAELVDSSSHRRCRCFMRSLTQDRKADALQLLVAGAELPAEIAAAARAAVRKQRQQLFAACAGHRSVQPTADEERQCNNELGLRAAIFQCALEASHRSGHAVHRSAAGRNCSKDAKATIVPQVRLVNGTGLISAT